MGVFIAASPNGLCPEPRGCPRQFETASQVPRHPHLAFNRMTEEHQRLADAFGPLPGGSPPSHRATSALPQGETGVTHETASRSESP